MVRSPLAAARALAHPGARRARPRDPRAPRLPGPTRGRGPLDGRGRARGGARPAVRRSGTPRSLRPLDTCLARSVHIELAPHRPARAGRRPGGLDRAAARASAGPAAPHGAWGSIVVTIPGPDDPNAVPRIVCPVPWTSASNRCRSPGRASSAPRATSHCPSRRVMPRAARLRTAAMTSGSSSERSPHAGRSASRSRPWTRRCAPPRALSSPASSNASGPASTIPPLAAEEVQGLGSSSIGSRSQ